MSDAPKTRIEEIQAAFLVYATRMDISPISWRPFQNAFVTGEMYGRELAKRECICGGTGSREYKDQGHCTCPGCRPFRHLSAENSGGVECGMLDVNAIHSTDELSEVTCADCLLRMLRDSDKCSTCGDDNINVCNGCH